MVNSSPTRFTLLTVSSATNTAMVRSTGLRYKLPLRCWCKAYVSSGWYQLARKPSTPHNAVRVSAKIVQIFLVIVVLTTVAQAQVPGHDLEYSSNLQISAENQAEPLGVLTGRPTIRPTHAETPPTINGRLDDLIWKRSVKITDFEQYQPVDGAPPSESTDMYVAYDRDHLYFAFYAYYSDRKIMRANRVDRDQATQDDLLIIYLDTFMNQQRSFTFEVNAYNVQGDGIINVAGRSTSRGAGIPSADRSWDALFESATQIVEDGFTAEVAIPFKSLRYPRVPENVPHQWGFQFVREIKERDRESIVWAPMSRDIQSFMRQFGVLKGMTNLSTGRNLEVLPTFTGINFGTLNTATGEFPAKSYPEGGVNVKYGFSSNLVADFTFNPDFSQIESDLPQIEVNQRFPLFFQELRPFFVEGNEIFEINGPVTYVHTRTIIDPLLGAKLTGKVGKFTIGVLTANDEALGNLEDQNDPLFGHNAQTFIGRVKYDLYSESHIGAIFTNREYLGGRSTLGGFDSSFRLSPQHVFRLTAIGSQETTLDGRQNEGHVFDVNLNQNGRNLDWFINVFEITPNFGTDVGFVRRIDQRRAEGRISYRWFPQNWIIDWGTNLSYGRNWNFDGSLEDENTAVRLSAQFARNLVASGGMNFDMERFAGVDFQQNSYFFTGGMNNRTFSVRVNVRAGDQIFFDKINPYLGHEVGTSLRLTMRPFSRLQSDLSLTTSRFTDSRNNNEQVFNVKITRLQTTYQLTDRLRVRNITEYDTFDTQLDFNLLITYRVNGGTVFYVGYDDHYRQDRFIEDFEDQRFLHSNFRRTNRAIFTKLQYLFRY